jgi:hypothetical protein
MIRRIPDGVVARLAFASGLIWVIFGSALLVAFVFGVFAESAKPFDGLILPVFGVVSLGTDFAINWLHVLGFLLAPVFCIAVGLAICIFVAGIPPRRRSSDIL